MMTSSLKCVFNIKKLEILEFTVLLNSDARSRASAAAAACCSRERLEAATGRRKITVGVSGKEKRRQTERSRVNRV